MLKSVGIFIALLIGLTASPAMAAPEYNSEPFDIPDTPPHGGAGRNVYCSANKFAVGGGFETSSIISGSQVVGSYPLGDGRGWRVDVTNVSNSTTTLHFRAYVICY